LRLCCFPVVKSILNSSTQAALATEVDEVVDAAAIVVAEADPEVDEGLPEDEVHHEEGAGEGQARKVAQKSLS
jgi:hypothetical protein